MREEDQHALIQQTVQQVQVTLDVVSERLRQWWLVEMAPSVNTLYDRLVRLGLVDTVPASRLHRERRRRLHHVRRTHRGRWPHV